MVGALGCVEKQTLIGLLLLLLLTIDTVIDTTLIQLSASSLTSGSVPYDCIYWNPRS